MRKELLVIAAASTLLGLERPSDHGTALRRSRPDRRIPPCVQVCVPDRCRAESLRMERPGGRASTLVVDDHHGRSEVKALPDMGCALRPAGGSQDGTMTSVCAAQSPCGAPPPESNRRPHPYHGSCAYRCADHRFRRSLTTVDRQVMCSSLLHSSGAVKPSVASGQSTSLPVMTGSPLCHAAFPPLASSREWRSYVLAGARPRPGFCP
jgi:hypothetical protein